MNNVNLFVDCLKYLEAYQLTNEGCLEDEEAKNLQQTIDNLKELLYKID